MSTGVIQYAEHEYDNHFVPSIDLSILLIFCNFRPLVAGDMSTGAIRYDKHEYDDPIPRDYGVIDFVDFICSYLVVCKNSSTGVLQHAEREHGEDYGRIYLQNKFSYFLIEVNEKKIFWVDRENDEHYERIVGFNSCRRQR